jgi:acetyl-CoA carboxylase biotin carboxyl carrier protein
MASTTEKEKSRLDLPEIQKLIRMIEKSPITEFELVERDLRIKISKNGFHSATHVYSQPSLMPAMQMAAPAATSGVGGEAAPPAFRKNVFEIKAPMVGTFYRASSPDSDPYVRVGDMVEPGRVLCIVEAMKLMNEVECEVTGRILEIIAENAQPVEYGQALFRIDTSGG